MDFSVNNYNATSLQRQENNIFAFPALFFQMESKSNKGTVAVSIRCFHSLFLCLYFSVKANIFQKNVHFMDF